MDLLGPLKKPTGRGKKYILTIIDFATRYPKAAPLARNNAHIIVQALSKVFARLGWPLEILTDYGTNFLSNVMGKLWEKYWGSTF